MTNRAKPFVFPGGHTSETFLESFWQRQPLLCPKAFERGEIRLTDEDVLEVAIQDTCDARLIMLECGKHLVEQGPFPVDHFDVLPTSPWSVLIQSMEVWHPELQNLQSAFDFLPRWRFDDVMVSLSSADGGVGPHVDQYDVFLVQAAGHRRWSWGGPVYRSAEDVALRQVSRFEPTDHAELESGDVLYLPPGVPHDGIALSDGAITISIGFRAPGITDLIGNLADVVAETWDDAVEAEPRFGDAGRPATEDPWLVSGRDMKAMRQVLVRTLEDEELTARALGEQISMPRFPAEAPDAVPEPGELERLLKAGWTLERWAGSRIFHHPLDTQRALLFVDGFSLPVPGAFAAWVAGQETINADAWRKWHKNSDALLAIMMMVGRGTFGLVPASDDNA